MLQPPEYSIDTSALLDGYTRHYTPDVFLGVWERLSEFARSGGVVAVEEVKVELEKKASDEVYNWVKRHLQFIPLDTHVQQAAMEILREHPRLVMKGKSRSIADPFVIAVARVYACKVVTGELRRNLSRPNIPDVCEALGVPWTNLLGMFREQHWQFPISGQTTT